ncbi:MAG: hypothetical protein V2J26_02550 [Pacificimonas sp.]|nr:hypothetical protein [Pacificimonas sp.]
MAYYDAYADCIRVMIRDRSVTEERLDELFTVYRTNHAEPFDPVHVGFCIKGVRHLFRQAGVGKNAELRLTEIFDMVTKQRPRSIVSAFLAAFPQKELVVDLADFKEAA